MARLKVPVFSRRNQIDFLGDLVVDLSVERKLIVSSANEIFGTSDPIPEFDELAGHFRIWALTQYPALADRIDSALRDARAHYFDGKDEPGEAASRAAQFVQEAQAVSGNRRLPILRP